MDRQDSSHCGSAQLCPLTMQSPVRTPAGPCCESLSQPQARAWYFGCTRVDRVRWRRAGVQCCERRAPFRARLNP
eukprot:2032822-Prymnesium_polylepis.1